MDDGPRQSVFRADLGESDVGSLFGRGIIHPIDDARSTNPPSNPELLDALARRFVESGYDLKDLIRRICNSYAYGLSSKPNESNADDTQTFARFYPRRLPAEVLLDAFSQVLDVPTQFPGGPGAFPPERARSISRMKTWPRTSWMFLADRRVTRPANANGEMPPPWHRR